MRLTYTKEKETKMDTITPTAVKTMMHDIDVRLDRKSHYDECFGHLGLSYRVGHHKYVTFEDLSSTFEEYAADHKNADWACYLYILAKNQPEYLDFYTRAYNIGGMETLEAIYNNVTETTPMTVIYPIYKH